MTNINVIQLKERLNNGELLNVIDVREQNEFDTDNIGAILLPLSSLRNFESDIIDDLKEKEIIVHCRSGVRSVEASMLLEQMGFTNVVNLEGGINAWREQIGSDNLK